MRYFTRGWHAGELDDAESEAVRVAYQARLAAITPQLPEALLRLASELDVHDGIIDSVCWHPRRHVLELVLVCRALDASGRGSSDVEARIEYRGAMLGEQRVRTLQRVATSRETEVLYDEVDLNHDGSFAHRLLFEPAEELTIDFTALDLVIRARADRRVALLGSFVIDDAEA
jgi:hypothetical protein